MHPNSLKANKTVRKETVREAIISVLKTGNYTAEQITEILKPRKDKRLYKNSIRSRCTEMRIEGLLIEVDNVTVKYGNRTVHHAVYALNEQMSLFPVKKLTKLEQAIKDMEALIAKLESISCKQISATPVSIHCYMTEELSNIIKKYK